MWYAFWLISVVLAGLLTVLYALKKEEKNDAQRLLSPEKKVPDFVLGAENTKKIPAQTLNDFAFLQSDKPRKKRPDFLRIAKPLDSVGLKGEKTGTSSSAQTKPAEPRKKVARKAPKKMPSGKKS